MVLKAYDMGHDVRGTIASSYTLHNVSMGLNTRKKGFSSFYSMLLIPTHRMQKKTGRIFRREVTRNVCKIGRCTYRPFGLYVTTHSLTAAVQAVGIEFLRNILPLLHNNFSNDVVCRSEADVTTYVVATDVGCNWSGLKNWIGRAGINRELGKEVEC